MEDNPYSTLAGMMGGTPSAGKLRIATVTSANPLTLDIGGLPVGITELRWNALLLHRSEKAAVTNPLGVLRESSVPSAFSFDSGSFTADVGITPEPLKRGDALLTYSEDDQTFIVLCKVV